MNLEYRRLASGYLVILTFCLGAAAFMGWEAACLAAAAATAMTALCLTELRRRNRAIDGLCEKLDRILFQDEAWDFSSYQEGELSILQDKVQKLTIRLREQADLLKKEKQLQEQMMTDISHQLKTPLTSMNLILTRLRKEQLSREEQRKYLFELEQLAGRIDDLIVTLLKMAKLDSGTAIMKQEPVQISSMLKRALEPLEISMDLRGISCDLSGDESASYQGDMEWSGEAFLNILKNSMEHMSPGGKIAVSFIENEIYSEIEIRDQGSGMPEEELPHLFDRFYRGKDARHTGFGIGLSFARMVIQQQNGTIKARNLPEGGMGFTVRFYREPG